MNRRGVLIFVLIIVLGLIAAVTGIWRQHQIDSAATESRRSDYAQCVVLNAQRKDNRKMALILYGVISDRLVYDPPKNPKLTTAYRLKLGRLTKLAEAQRPLDCATYVRAELPPDRGD